MRDRDEHVEGLTEPHDLELLLDKARVQVFTVKPPQREPEPRDGRSRTSRSACRCRRVRTRSAWHS